MPRADLLATNLRQIITLAAQSSIELGETRTNPELVAKISPLIGNLKKEVIALASELSIDLSEKEADMIVINLVATGGGN